MYVYIRIQLCRIHTYTTYVANRRIRVESDVKMYAIYSVLPVHPDSSPERTPILKDNTQICIRTCFTHST
jgi:hypothetical protein